MECKNTINFLNCDIDLSSVTPIICIQLPIEVLGKRKIGEPNTHNKCHKRLRWGG